MCITAFVVDSRFRTILAEALYATSEYSAKAEEFMQAAEEYESTLTTPGSATQSANPSGSASGSTVPPTPIPTPDSTLLVSKPPVARMNQPVFEGLLGESPKEYTDDLELYVKELDPAMKEEIRETKLRSLFRNGLRGNAKSWYLQLPESKRAKYDSLKSSLDKRFPVRVRTNDAGLASRIDNFERQSREKLSTFVKRANELSQRADDRQLMKLRDRMYKYMCSNGNYEDKTLQNRVTDRLFAKDKIDDVNEMDERCTFHDVRDTIISCGMMPGQEDDFIDEVEGYVGGTRLTTEDTIHELGMMIRGMRENGMVPIVQRGQQSQTPVTSLSETPRFAPTPEAQYDGQVYQPPQQTYPVQTFPMSAQAQWTGQRGGQNGDQRGPSSSNWRSTAAPPAQQVRRNSGNYGNRARFVPVCYNCGHEGHVSPDCPHPDQPSQTTRRIRDICDRGEPVPEPLKFKEAPKSTDAKTGCVVKKGSQEPFDLNGYVDDLNEEPLSAIRGSSSSFTTGSMQKTQSMVSPSHMDVDEDEGMLRRKPTPNRRSPPPDLPAGSRYDPMNPHKLLPKPRKTNLPGPDLMDASDLAQRLMDAKSRMRKKITKPQKQGDTVPIRAYEDHVEDRIDVGDLLRMTPFPNITWGQFLDRSPTIRAQLSRQLGLSTKGHKPKVPPRYRPSVPAPHSAYTYAGMSGFNFVDRARDDDGQTFLGFIDGEVNGILVRRCLVDCGSLSELISPGAVTKLGLKKLELREECELKMADDSTSPISHYVVFPFIVGGILSVIRAFVVGMNESYDLLLGKGWLRRNSADINFRTECLTLTGIDGQSCTLSMKPAAAIGPISVERKSTHEKVTRPTFMEDADSESSSVEDGDLSDNDDSDSEEETKYHRELMEELFDIAEYAVVQDRERQTQSKN